MLTFTLHLWCEENSNLNIATPNFIRMADILGNHIFGFKSNRKLNSSSSLPLTIGFCIETTAIHSWKNRKSLMFYGFRANCLLCSKIVEFYSEFVQELNMELCLIGEQRTILYNFVVCKQLHALGVWLSYAPKSIQCQNSGYNMVDSFQWNGCRDTIT